ncbi:MAG: DUF1499 domain-containing protein [Roseobacter sp.]
MIKILGLVGLVVLLAGLFYVRLAPNDPDKWHTAIQSDVDRDLPGGAVRVMAAEPDTLTRADVYMRSLPRTHVIAGSVDTGRITYITRSAVFGFPDYTTVEYQNGQLRAFARLRFGRSDLGVNSERLQGLRAALE